MVSTIVLVRLLAPEDFGVVAMGMLVIALLQVISDLGVARLLIRIEDPVPAHYNTAWTIIILQSLVVASLLYLSAPLAAHYFNEIRVLEVIRLLALGGLISAFSNIGIINFRKELQFNKDFIYEIICKIAAVTVTVTMAFMFRSYWALVYGMLVAGVLRVLLSYYFHEYRPKFSLEKWREFLSFSLWVTPTNVAHFALERTDAMLVGIVHSTSQLGIYNVASEVSKMVTTEIIIPMGRALYPNYAKLLDSPELLAETYRNIVRIVVIVCLAVGPGLAVVAEDFVYILLGDQWIFAIPLVRWFALTGAFGSIVFVLRDQIFVVTGKERLALQLYSVQVLFTIPVLIYVGTNYGMTELAAATAITSGMFILVAGYNVGRAIPLSLRQLLLVFLRPTIAATIMVLAVLSLHADNIESHIITLVFDVIIGAAVYIATLIFLWFVTGRSDGPEASVIAFVMKKVSGQGR